MTSGDSRTFNWARSFHLSNANQVCKPVDEQDLAGLMSARQASQKIKVMGSGMSYLGISALDSLSKDGEAGDIFLDLSLFAGLKSKGDDWAEFGGSSIVQDIADTLLSHGQQLISCPGVLMTQTIAGAISTGTHGQDMSNGGLYDGVIKVTAVLADGSIKSYEKGDEGFDAFRLHLGALGIITRITIKTVPVCTYRLTKALTDFEDLQSNFITWNEASEHTKAWWFPESDSVQLWRTFKATKQEDELYKENGSVTYQIPETAPVLTRAVDDFSRSIENLVEKMDEDTKRISLADKNQDKVLNRPNARFDTVTRFKSLNHCLGNMFQLWCKGIPAPQVNCEIAVPLEKLSAALDKLRAYYHSSGQEMHYPFILRATGASDAWLSPSYGRSVCYIGFLVYLSEDFQGNDDRLQTLREIEEVLAEFDALPHYGKFYTKSLYPMKERLPKFEDFRAFRAKIDPTGVFLNKYLNDLFDDESPIKC